MSVKDRGRRPEELAQAWGERVIWLEGRVKHAHESMRMHARHADLYERELSEARSMHDKWSRRAKAQEKP